MTGAMAGYGKFPTPEWGRFRRWLNDRWRMAHGWTIRAGQWVRR